MVTILPLDSCPVCCATVEQSGRGRPRVYCSTHCRQRAARDRRRGIRRLWDAEREEIQQCRTL